MRRYQEARTMAWLVLREDWRARGTRQRHGIWGGMTEQERRQAANEDLPEGFARAAG